MRTKQTMRAELISSVRSNFSHTSVGGKNGAGESMGSAYSQTAKIKSWTEVKRGVERHFFLPLHARQRCL